MRFAEELGILVVCIWHVVVGDMIELYDNNSSTHKSAVGYAEWSKFTCFVFAHFDDALARARVIGAAICLRVIYGRYGKGCE